MNENMNEDMTQKIEDAIEDSIETTHVLEAIIYLQKDMIQRFQKKLLLTESQEYFKKLLKKSKTDYCVVALAKENAELKKARIQDYNAAFKKGFLKGCSVPVDEVDEVDKNCKHCENYEKTENCDSCEDFQKLEKDFAHIKVTSMKTIMMKNKLINELNEQIQILTPQADKTLQQDFADMKKRLKTEYNLGYDECREHMEEQARYDEVHG